MLVVVVVIGVAVGTPVAALFTPVFAVPVPVDDNVALGVDELATVAAEAPVVSVRVVGVGDACCGGDELVGDMDGGDVDGRDDEFALALAVALASTKLLGGGSAVAAGPSATAMTGRKRQGSSYWRWQRPTELDDRELNAVRAGVVGGDGDSVKGTACGQRDGNAR